MIDIALINETEKNTDEYNELIEGLFKKALEIEGIDRYIEVGVIFVTKEKIQEMNRNYRKIDKVTDVISFALDDEDDGIADRSLISTLGDIFICLDVAFEQAEEYGHSVNREVGFLALHGLLHLLGYDHLDPEEETTMNSRQEQILNEFNLKR